MKYLLKHKKHKTYYCFDKEDDYRFFKIGSKWAYRFGSKTMAYKMRNSFNYPNNWKVVCIKDE